MEREHKATFCRICEPLCGMIATVESGRLVALRPDRDHPLSSGFACQKGIAFSEIVNDPDRVTVPLRRRATVPPGSSPRAAAQFEPVSWDDAMSDIADRLAAIHRRHGAGAIGWYLGNPSVFSYSHLLGVALFVAGFALDPKALGGQRGPHVFSAGSQDINSRFVASQLLYGSPFALPVPDVLRTDLLVVIGANPLVSHGSVITLPRIRDRLRDIVERGGRVVVIDPRRTETAAKFEWLGIIPDGDAFFLLSILHVLFAEGLADEAALARQADGVPWLRQLAEPFSPEETESRTGIAPDTLRSLARDLADTPRSAVYGRVGTSVGQSGTLTTYLLDSVNLVTGSLDRAGGSMFGSYGFPAERWAMKAAGALMRAAYRRRSRVGGFPSVLGTEPAAIMAKEITTEGVRQIRALFVSAGNPVLSVPNGDELEAALAGLELMVGIDLYVNETTAHCDYVLPATSMYERDDFPVVFQAVQPIPFRQATEAVIAPVGQSRTEWDVIDDLTARLWRRTPVFALLGAIRKVLSLLRIRVTPRLIVDAVIRLGEGGDRFGLRPRGLTFARLTVRHPHGAVLALRLRQGVLADTVVYRGGRMRLRHNEIAAEVDALARRAEADGYPLRLIGMRELRSENSWLHNAPRLMQGAHSQRALVHAGTAAAAGIADGDVVRIVSKHGAIEVPATLTTKIMPAVVAVPHGWGHRGSGGWSVANAAGGASVNTLMSSEPEDLEKLAGMARLTGVPVRIEPVKSVASPQH